MLLNIFAIACSAILSASSPQKSAAPQHAGYVKPGAAITLSHDYDGQTNIGEFETVTTSLSHMYSDGFLSIDLIAPPDIHISSFQPGHKLPISSGSSLVFPFQFSSSKAGHYSISLQAIYETPNGQQSRRVVSIPVAVGLKPHGKTSPQVPDNRKIKLGGLVSLPAQEVIK